EIADAHILVVATYRSVGSPAHAQLADALSVVVRQPIARRFDLDGLDRDALGELVEASGGHRTDDELSAIHRRTQGNPFFAVEVLRLLGDDHGGGAGDQPVPAGVRDVVRQRLRALPEPTSEVLAAASVLGLDIDVATIALALGTDAAEVLDRLEPALAGGVVVAGAGPLDLRFSHGLVSETAYGDLTVVAKLRGHLRAADALAARHGRGDGPHLADIAAHRCRAVPVGSTEDAVNACLRAVTWLVGNLAHQEADELMVRALDLVAALPAGQERDVLELRLQDRLWLLRMMTRGYGSPGVVDGVRRMGELCEVVDDIEVAAPVVWRLVNYLCVAAVFDEAQRLSRRLLAVRSPTPDVVWASHLAMGITLTHLGQVAEAKPHFDLSASAPVQPDRGAEAAYTAWNLLLGGDEAGADALVLATAQDLRPVGGYPSAITGWFATLMATLRRDEEAVLERCERWIAVAQKQGMVVFVPYMAVCRGWAVAVRDDVELGIAEMEAAADQIAATGARMLNNVFHGLKADALLVADRPADALVSADEALRLVERSGERWFEAEIHRLRGRALLGIDATDPAGAEAIRTALAVATAQGAATYAARAQADADVFVVGR
ncbi:MAG TPA: hypothetical protein VK507_16625, partial [Iamia sp.]|nr:hypothetical protein [Iamia sp.]